MGTTHKVFVDGETISVNACDLSCCLPSQKSLEAVWNTGDAECMNSCLECSTNLLSAQQVNFDEEISRGART